MAGCREYLHLLSDYVLKQHRIDEETPHELVEMDAIDLFVPERIDIAAKLKFIEAHQTGVDIDEAELLYKKHIDAFTDGMFTEYGNPEKNSYEKYRESFLQLIDSIKINGFSSKISMIPVGADNVAIGGAHRIACAIYFNQKVKTVKFDHIKTVFDYEYFRKHLLKEKYLIQMTEVFIKYKKDSYITFIWPRGYRHRKAILEDFDFYGAKIVYSKSAQFDYKTYWKIVFDVYKDEDWIGTEEDGYEGITGKALFTYDKPGKMLFLVLNGITPEIAMNMKNEIRKKIGQKKRTMHMTDTKQEALEMIPVIIKTEISSVDRIDENVHLIKKKLKYLYRRLLIVAKKKLGYPV